MSESGAAAATPEQIVAAALQRCADEQGFPGAPDLDLVTPEAAAPVVVAALREAGMLADPNAERHADRSRR